jgi:hypothetical protein
MPYLPFHPIYVYRENFDRMEPGKGQTELVLNMYLDKLMILQPSELASVNSYNYFDTDAPCQVYFICRRPLITIDPRSFKVARDKMELTFKVKNGQMAKNFDFVFENPFQTSALTLHSDPPYSVFSIKKRDETLITVKTGAFLQSFPQEATNTDFLDLEVLYIGQTCGVEQAGISPGKLKDHKTLQSVYAAAVQKNPDHEICLLLASFQQHNLIMTDGRKKIDKGNGSVLQDTPLYMHPVVNAAEVNGQQMINITEAALIRYFEPPYNSEFKDIVENPAEKTYPECHNLNIYSIGIELDTYGIANCHIYSQKIEPKWLHMKTYLFHSSEERKEIFELLPSTIET